MTMCANAWQVTAREMRSRCVTTNDAIKSRSSAGSWKTGDNLEERFFATVEDGTSRVALRSRKGMSKAG